MPMTKKDYEWQAALISELANQPDPGQKDAAVWLANQWAVKLMADNSRFDADRWLVACGVKAAPPKPDKKAKLRKAKRNSPPVCDKNCGAMFNHTLGEHRRDCALATDIKWIPVVGGLQKLEID